MTKFDKTTVLTAQQREEIFARNTEGKTETFKTRYAAIFNDSRTWAFIDPDTGITVEGSEDMQRIISGDTSSPFALTQELDNAIEKLKIDTSRIYCTGAPMKAIKRFNQFLGAISAPVPKWESIDKTSAVILLALDYADGKPLQNDALLYLGTGAVKNEGMSADTRGVARSAIRAKLAQIDKGTMPTQISRSVGKSGFLQVCGAVHAVGKGKNAAYTINRAHPMTVAFLELMGRATPGQIEAMFA
ncbi:hypothetical protein ATN89_17595 [Comamonas thiooxydans]|uniref:hypothetical protein n=1 Tax=Comamonas thiooxydans TaxID=363952 RepID=UPI0007C50814|nr:hypothetical protein [Comamonas thiooxydans]OAD82896.1 hypothetical protein ATN89_17595 [Comamonas thiooxydans]